MTITPELLVTTEHLIRQCYDECASAQVAVEPEAFDTQHGASATQAGDGRAASHCDNGSSARLR